MTTPISNPGSRVYSHGIDRVYVYTEERGGEPWYGVTKIQEDPNSSVRRVYNDGVVVGNFITQSQIKLKVDAYSTPQILDFAMGNMLLPIGLTYTGQKPSPFHMTYRTYIGEGEDVAAHYRVHFIYNAICSDSGSSRSSMTDTIDPELKSFDIHTSAQFVNGRAPTSHIYLDSRYIDPYRLSIIENHIYGQTNGETALMMDPESIEEALSMNLNPETEP